MERRAGGSDDDKLTTSNSLLLTAFRGFLAVLTDQRDERNEPLWLCTIAKNDQLSPRFFLLPSSLRQATILFPTLLSTPIAEARATSTARTGLATWSGCDRAFPRTAPLLLLLFLRGAKLEASGAGSSLGSDEVKGPGDCARRAKSEKWERIEEKREVKSTHPVPLGGLLDLLGLILLNLLLLLLMLIRLLTGLRLRLLPLPPPARSRYGDKLGLRYPPPPPPPPLGEGGSKSTVT